MQAKGLCEPGGIGPSRSESREDIRVRPSHGLAQPFAELILCCAPQGFESLRPVSGGINKTEESQSLQSPRAHARRHAASLEGLNADRLNEA